MFTQNPISEHKHVYHSYRLLTSLYFSPLDQVHFSLFTGYLFLVSLPEAQGFLLDPCLFTGYLFLVSLPEAQGFLLDPWLHCQAQGSG